MTTPQSLLPIAVEAITIANKLLSTRAPGTVSTKGDRDMASELDYAIERAVRQFLADASPNIGFLGEEEGEQGDTDGDTRWVLDPIDGTANFTHGLPLCGISLGLVQGSRPILGVIDLPFLGLRYSATLGEGAYSNNRKLQVSKTNTLADATIAIGDFAVGYNAVAKNRLRLAVAHRLAEGAQRVRMLGSAAVDLAWVAEGRLDASIILSNKTWDTCAGVVIAREAGAIVLDKDGSDHTVNSQATITANPALIQDVIHLVQQADAQ